jgi:hypothetical protein
MKFDYPIVNSDSRLNSVEYFVIANSDAGTGLLFLFKE